MLSLISRTSTTYRRCCIAVLVGRRHGTVYGLYSSLKDVFPSQSEMAGLGYLRLEKIGG